MRRLIATALLISAGAIGQVSVGVRIGPPPPPRVVAVRPVAPGPDYNWVDGYWYPVDGRYIWHDGYWTRPPYSGARWMGPHYDRDRFYDGRWEGDRGVIVHDHRWDRDHDRDWHHDRDRDRDRDRDHDRR